jgi:ferrochelatase
MPVTAISGELSSSSSPPAPLTGIVLVNLGTPQEPTAAAVRRFLAEFLWDRRVVDTPRWLWWLVLHGVILRVRPARSARAYRKIWTALGSPLAVLSERLAADLARRLQAQDDGLTVRLAMRYGEPSLPRVLGELRERGLTRLLVLPLYPQYSATTTASVFDAVTAELSRWRRVPQFRFIDGYHADPAYLDAVAESIRAQRTVQDPGDLLLFSFHGIPQRYVAAGDPYYRQCLQTARGVAERLGLTPERHYRIGFQSRVGREEWLRPYTDELLRELPAAGVRKLDVVCPGFAVDCLETLEEIALQGQETFRAAGGEQLRYIPALNDATAHVEALAWLVRTASADWTAPARRE